MRYELIVNCVNAAFYDGDGEFDPKELSRILRKAADNLEQNPFIRKQEIRLFDINGNYVGKTRLN
jgi:hypothetical protein